jgi:hypothetical protein
MKKSYLLGSLASLALAFTATADVIPTLSSITPNGGNSFTWNYTSTVTNDQMLISGNFFTIYDFSSLAPTTIVAPLGWTFTTQTVGVTPGLTNPPDSATLFNITFTYTGQTSVIGPDSLGTFSINTDTNQIMNGYFAAEATRSTGPNAGTPIDNVGRLAVPVPEMSALAPLLGACGIGAVGVASSLFRRRQKQG